jgi:ankyrin repeat protein
MAERLSRTRVVWRWAGTAVLFLALGLVTSVGVAWAFAAMFEHAQTSEAFNFLPGEAAQWRGVEVVAAALDHHRDPPVWSRDSTVQDGYSPGPVPDWSMLIEPPPEDGLSVYETATGWPRVCLFCRVDWRADDWMLSTDFPDGAIEGHLPASMLPGEGRDVLRLPATPITKNLFVDGAFWGVVIAALCFGWRVVVRLHWLQRRRRRRCGYCGYLLVHIESDVCPECGTDIVRPPPLGGKPRLSRLVFVLVALVAIEGLFIGSFMMGGRDYALLRAAYEGDIPRLRAILARGVDPDIKLPVRHPEAALFVASAKGRAEAVEVLLEAGADVDVRCGLMKRAPLHAAAAGGHIDAIQRLCEAGADIDILDAKDGTPLHLAARSGKHGSAVSLLRYGADVSTRDRTGATAMIRAADNGDLSLVQMLEQAGADIDTGDTSDQTPMFFAAYAGHIEVAEYLLGRGADIGITTREGQNFWMPYQTVLASEALTQALIASGADINQRTNNGMTPLMSAALSGTPDEVRLLLKYGADPLLTDQSGRSVYDIARRENQIVLFEAMQQRRQGRDG